METARQKELTLGEAARLLDTNVDALLQLVYGGQLAATVQRSTGRLLLNGEDIALWRSQERASPTG